DPARHGGAQWHVAACLPRHVRGSGSARSTRAPGSVVSPRRRRAFRVPVSLAHRALAAGDARAEYAGDPGSVPARVELPRNRCRGTLSLAPDGALGGDGGRGRGLRIAVADTGQRISLLPVLAG